MKLDYISARGDRLPLVGNELFDLTNIDGQTAAATSISSNVIGGADGDTVNNVQANARSIVLDLRIKNGVDVEDAKREILKLVKVKQLGTLEWTQRNKTVVISGIVEAVEMPRWNNAVTMQITMYCSQPFWEDAAYVVQQISEALDLHYFTTSRTGMMHFPVEGIPLGEYDTTRTKKFYNNGDVSVGFEISIVALDTVTNPIIYDGNGNFFGVGYGDGGRRVVMTAGDNIVITTHKGAKSVKLNGRKQSLGGLGSNSTTDNGVSLLSKVKPQSKWLQLSAGENVFTINSDDDNVKNMTFSLVYKQRYI